MTDTSHRDFFYACNPFVIRFGGLLVRFVGFLEINRSQPIDIQNIYVYLSQMCMVFITGYHTASGFCGEGISAEEV